MLNIDLSGLEGKWSLISHENCCECGVSFDVEGVVPLRFWKDPDTPQCTELALCWSCAQKRMKPKGG